MKLDEQAREIMEKAMERVGNISYLSAFYGVPPDIIHKYLKGGYCGTLRAREVIRVEIARISAEKKGLKEFWPTHKDRYKGTREI